MIPWAVFSLSTFLVEWCGTKSDYHHSMSPERAKWRWEGGVSAFATEPNQLGSTFTYSHKTLSLLDAREEHFQTSTTQLFFACPWKKEKTKWLRIPPFYERPQDYTITNPPEIVARVRGHANPERSPCAGQCKCHQRTAYRIEINLSSLSDGAQSCSFLGRAAMLLAGQCLISPSFVPVYRNIKVSGRPKAPMAPFDSEHGVYLCKSWPLSSPTCVCGTYLAVSSKKANRGLGSKKNFPLAFKGDDSKITFKTLINSYIIKKQYEKSALSFSLSKS